MEEEWGERVRKGSFPIHKRQELKWVLNEQGKEREKSIILGRGRERAKAGMSQSSLRSNKESAAARTWWTSQD